MSTASSPMRFVALDSHRKYLVVGAVDSGQQVVLTPRRFGFEAFSAWAPTHLGPSDAVVLEATSNAWLLYDQLEPLVGSVTVAHPLAVKLIAAARVKTDSRDTIKLAHLLAANLVPAVWVPPVHVRELRALVSHRKRLVNQRTQVRNRLHAVLHRHPPHLAVRQTFCRPSAAMVAFVGPLILREAACATRPLSLAFLGGTGRSR